MVPCPGTNQDGEHHLGHAAASPRFSRQDEIVRDTLTGLDWTLDANPGVFPLSWEEALAAVEAMNRKGYGGHRDWRLPNRRELRSLMHYQTRKPALPSGHFFTNVFLGWYWTSTSAAIHPAYAWCVHLEGARMFYGRKDQYSLYWPVRGESRLLAATGQQRCFRHDGVPVDCAGSGQDGEKRYGLAWPRPRFVVTGEVVEDLLTGLCWLRDGDIAKTPTTWQEALDLVASLNRASRFGRRDWRLPNVNELESLVDADRHSPALPADHPFAGVQDVYWSSTTSYFETDWAWALYLDKGALGVGHKPGRNFYVWPVTSAQDSARGGK